jgi:DNA-binding NtrC family response regulator
MADDEVNFQHREIPAPPQSTTAMLQFAVGTPLAEIERRVIVATLEQCRGHKRETAELLGVSLKTLYNRLNEYDYRNASSGERRSAA